VVKAFSIHPATPKGVGRFSGASLAKIIVHHLNFSRAEVKMRLLHVCARSPYLNTVCQLLMLSALVRITDGHCYTTSISVPEMTKPKHIDLALDIEAEITSLDHSILEITNEIQMKPPAAPIFLALLCLSGFDLSEMEAVPLNKTLFAAYILPDTSYVLLAHPTGHITSFFTKKLLNFTRALF
jgi:hypothetical protein